MEVKRELQPALRRNRAKAATSDALTGLQAGGNAAGSAALQGAASRPQVLLLSSVACSACSASLACWGGSAGATSGLCTLSAVMQDCRAA